MLQHRDTKGPRTGRWCAEDIKNALVELAFDPDQIAVAEFHVPGAYGFEVTIPTGLTSPASVGAALRYGHDVVNVDKALRKLQLELAEQVSQGFIRYDDLYQSTVYVDTTTVSRINIISGARQQYLWGGRTG